MVCENCGKVVTFVVVALTCSGMPLIELFCDCQFVVPDMDDIMRVLDQDAYYLN